MRRDARQLLREIQTRSAEVRRSNKRLAQAVGKWVATAMAQSTDESLHPDQPGGDHARGCGDAGPPLPAATAAAVPRHSGTPTAAGGPGRAPVGEGGNSAHSLATAGAALAAAGVTAAAAVAWASL